MTLLKEKNDIVSRQYLNWISTWAELVAISIILSLNYVSKTKKKRNQLTVRNHLFYMTIDYYMIDI